MKEIDIIIYLPGQKEETREGSLRVPKEGKPFFIFYKPFPGQRGFQSLDLVYGVTKAGGVKYSFVNCYFIQHTNQRHKYGINELYENAWVEEATTGCYRSVTFSVSHLTLFIDQRRTSSFGDIAQDNRITIHPPFIKESHFADGCVLQMQQYTQSRYNTRGVTIADRSCFNIKGPKQLSRWKLFDLGAAAIKLFSLFTLKTPVLDKAIFFTEDDRRVELTLGSNKPPDEPGFLPVTYGDLVDQWDAIVNVFFARQQEFVKIIDLLEESLTNHTAEIAFLNATTALEVIHKSFYAPMDETEITAVKEELQQAIGLNPKQGVTQIHRHYYLLKQLLPMPAFEQRVDNLAAFANKLTNSRNYYTHYGEKKGEVWTANQLHLVNNLLQQMLRTLVLQQLKVPEESIVTLVNQSLFFFSHSYEKNKFSIHYLPPDSLSNGE